MVYAIMTPILIKCMSYKVIEKKKKKNYSQCTPMALPRGTIHKAVKYERTIFIDLLTLSVSRNFNIWK